ncbi:MAG: hypothetical protein JSW27_19205 [Phycisphaerales bacterium]|nr:MAG: hypothetical protein JSW27_19205 [Phycisphaerales bacterium]
MMTESHKASLGPASKILLAIAALLAALVLHEVAEFALAVARAELVVARATDATATGSNDAETHLGEAKSVAEALKKKNLFAPPPPKQNPVREVLGILGDEALINDKWYKAGDSVGDAKILAVGPTKVRVSWNGQEKEFSPLSSEGGGPGAPPGRTGGPPGAPPGRVGGPPGPPQNVQGGRMRVRSSGPPGMTPEEQAALRERFRNASPEEQAKLREQMRERVAPPGR